VVNPISNKIYVTGHNIGLSVIDGASNTINKVLRDSSIDKIVVNPVSNKIYYSISKPAYVINQTPEISHVDVSADIDSLINNVTYAATPAITGKAVNRLRPGHSGISNVLQYMNTAQNPWNYSSITENAGTDSVTWAWNWGSDTLLFGENFLCFAPLDSQCAATNNTGLASPFTGNLSAYPIYRIMQPGTPPTPPSAPILVSPSDSAVDVQLSVTLVWNSVSSASSYTLQVALDSAFSVMIFNTCGINDTFQSISGLTNSTSYFWKVNAYNGTMGPWSSVWTFSTFTPIPLPPIPPLLSSPANTTIGVSTNPILSWNSADRAASYTVQVSTDSNFSTLAVDDSGITDTFHTVTGLSEFTVYYWRVRAVNAGGASSWSTVWNFITGTTATLPSTSPLPRAFSFSASHGSVRYSLPSACHVSLKYYDLRGRLVAMLINRTQGAGYYMLSIKNALPSNGSYIRVFEAGSFVKRELTTVIGN
jgi:hypothetical protein